MKAQWRWVRAAVGLAAVVLLGFGGVGVQARAQAPVASIPSAETQQNDSAAHARKLIAEMVAALGGEAWLNRAYWTEEGTVASFYKGQPTEGVFGFESYTRAQPFGERTIIISHFGVLIATNHRDVAEIWTPDAGYEVTYKGRTPVKPEELADFKRRQAHTLEAMVKDWLKQPGVMVTYDGSGMYSRRLVDTVSVLTANNDAMTINLDESTHLPVSRSFQYRDPVYHDLDTDVEQYDIYQKFQGIMTPMTVTRLHNGDMVSQRFLTKISYEASLPAELFDPNVLLKKK